LIFSCLYPPQVSGYSAELRAFAASLVSRGHSVKVVTCNTNKVASAENMDGVDVVRLPCWNMLGGLFPVPKPSRALWLLRNERPDVVSVQTRFFATTLMGTVLAREKRVRLVLTERGSTHSMSGNVVVDTLCKLYDHTVSSWIARSCDYCVGISDESCRFLAHLGGRHVTKVPLGVREPYISTGRRCDVQCNTVIFVGRLTRSKRVHDLLEVFRTIRKRVPGVKLMLVGDGDCREELEMSSGDDVLFLGMRRPDEVAHLLSVSSVFVSASCTEGMSLSVAEAATIGLPVVAYVAGGMRELIEDGVTGYLVEQGDIEGMASRVTGLLLDKEQAERMGKAGQEKMNREYGWDNVVDSYLSLFCGTQSGIDKHQ